MDKLIASLRYHKPNKHRRSLILQAQYDRENRAYLEALRQKEARSIPADPVPTPTPVPQPAPEVMKPRVQARPEWTPVETRKKPCGCGQYRCPECHQRILEECRRLGEEMRAKERARREEQHGFPWFSVLGP